jgi:hypothetical protein
LRTLDDLAAQVWAKIRDRTHDHAEEFTLVIAHIDGGVRVLRHQMLVRVRDDVDPAHR